MSQKNVSKNIKRPEKNVDFLNVPKERHKKKCQKMNPKTSCYDNAPKKHKFEYNL